ncbi:MAG: DNA mismatch repair endonuclease MutL [Defluviitaleaceae bacterium]|nr:DNA mismatch repair endonuclease MutL [Defluviitaleaceae bacterium]
MKKIKLLNNNMINKIAAGEVVERPSSVVKELVENAIDAGAGIITVEINESLIRVSDNGSGIPADQVEAVFLRHATSKIETIADLESVLTLGFRGEAMSSIAAVSRLELITSNPNDDMGTLIEINGGQIVKKAAVGAAPGTSVIVRNLFYNVPARLKFLKKPPTEFGYISDLIEKFALGNPKITFNYMLKGKKQQYGGGELKSAIYQIYGKEYYKDLLKVEREGSFGVSGYIAKPTSNRPNRTFGNFFINGRYIKSPLMQSAVEAAYKTKLPIGKFPVYVLQIHIDPRFADINVHPTKLEVRFQDDKVVYDLIYEAVNNTLNEAVLIPSPVFVAKNATPVTNDTKKIADPVSFVLKTTNVRKDEPKQDNKQDNKDDDKQKQLAVKEARPVYNHPEQIKLSETPKQERQDYETDPKLDPESPFLKDYTIIGLFFNTYWALEQAGTLFLIDQHAAHERILYDKLTVHMEMGKPLSQTLLRPVAVTLNPTEQTVYEENSDFFAELGFEIEDMGHNALALRGVPFIFGGGINPDVFLEILENINSRNAEKLGDEKLAKLACKAAVKGGDKLTPTEAKALIDSLLATKKPFTCPHGRPTIVKLSKYEMEKMFKRV